MKNFLNLVAALLLAFSVGCNHDNDDAQYIDQDGNTVITTHSGCSGGHCHSATTVTPAPAQVPAIIQVPAPAPSQDAPPVTITVTDPSPAPAVQLPAAAGVKRAVIVGVNKFTDPGAPTLTGCVPDAARIYAKCTGGGADKFAGKVDPALIAKCAVNPWGFDPKNIILLLDEDATVANVKAALIATVAASKPGDEFLYWSSSHGTEDTIPDDNGAVVHGMIVMHDFDWSREKEICDVDLRAIFAKLPAGVIFNHASDSCNSGTLDRNVGKHKHPVHDKALVQPPNVRIRVHAARINGAKTKGLINDELDVGYLPGCRLDQTSADSQDDDGYPGGALTIMAMKNFDAFADKPLTDLAKQIDQDLAANGYDQVSIPTGARKNKPWLKN